MENCTKNDLKLVEKAKKILQKNYKSDGIKHTVGCALTTKSGKEYLGINLDSIHSICGEQCAVSCAYVNGDRDIDTIVAVGIVEGQYQVLSPCGNCRQFLSEYAPNCKVIIKNGDELKKLTLEELLPYAYVCHVDYTK